MVTLSDLSDEQSAALSKINEWLDDKDPFASNIFTLTGYAGTGKSTLLPFILAKATSVFDSNRVYVCTPTGKALSVVKGKLNNTSARMSTIHKLLYTNFRTVYDEKTRRVKLLYDLKGACARGDEWDDWEVDDASLEAMEHPELTIVDEASMVSMKLSRDLLNRTNRILYIGDPFQLPPVISRRGDSQIEYINCPDATLTQVYRQGLNNPILRLATDLRLKEEVALREGAEGGTLFIKNTSRSERGKYLDKMFKVYDEDRDGIILCYTNSVRVNINRIYRSSHKGIYTQLPQEGERVVCLENNNDYDLYNGDISTVKRTKKYDRGGSLYVIELLGKEEPIIADSRSFNNRFIPKEELDRPLKLYEEYAKIPEEVRENNKQYKPCRFDYGYALTVHKSQGSEWKNVLVVNDFSMKSTPDYVHWLYTAVTRAKEKLIIIN